MAQEDQADGGEVSDCRHERIVPPPPGRHLRICLDCCKRLIECNSCDEKLATGPHVTDSGWLKHGRSERGDIFNWYTCPRCH